MEESTSRAEAERLLGIAEKLLQGKDLNGSRDFAILAQETEPLLEGSDQILAVIEVLLAAEKRINKHHDWYAILQLDRRSDDLELIKRQYRRLALLLHPDKNKFAFADSAFRLVADAWAVLSNAGKKSMYDNELSLFSKVDLVALKNPRGHQQQFRREQEEQQQQKLPVRRSSWVAGKSSGKGGSTSGDETRLSSFWTACPYCYNLFEYPRVYEDCCLRCQNCERAFHAALIPSLPPVIPGKEAYYCCWGFFPLGFAIGNSEAGKKAGYPNLNPPTFRAPGAGGATAEAARAAVPNGGADGFVGVSNANPNPAPKKKRGRPRKIVQA